MAWRARVWTGTIVVIAIATACSYHGHAIDDGPGGDAVATADAGGDAADQPDAPPGVLRSCKDVLAANPGAATGTYDIDPDGAGGAAGFAAYCDQARDAGGWTLIASMVNNDGARAWATLAAFTDPAPVFGTIANHTAADFKSPAYGAVAGDDLLIVTDQYAFAFHAALGTRTFGAYIAAGWPASCATAWREEGADYTESLDANQAAALGIILRGNDENDSRCFPTGDEIAVIAFVGGPVSNHGLGNAAVGSAWGQLDISLPNLAAFTPIGCAGSSYPCNAAHVDQPWTDYGASVKALRALVFVR
jgi:hypothetical protein